jgi:hypothetical protein
MFEDEQVQIYSADKYCTTCPGVGVLKKLSLAGLAKLSRQRLVWYCDKT